MRTEGAKGRSAADKERIGSGSRSAVLQVRYQRLTNLLGQRELRLTAAFSRDLNRRTFPVNVAQTKRNDIPRAKPQTGQKKQNRPIPLTNRRDRIA